MPTLAELDERLQVLSEKVYTEALKADIEGLVTDIPEPTTLGTAAEKIQAFLIRGKARLLLPVFSKESENDFNKALKLNQSNPDTWVALSEAYWRRNSVSEAKDALDSALRIDAKHQPALRQMSSVLRSMCTNVEAPTEQKTLWLADSVKYAKEAVGVNAEDGQSWCTLGIAILQETVAKGMDLVTMKKALSALNQGVKKAPHNPDALYNRGVIHQCFGHFGSAISDFMASYALDPKGLRGAKKTAEDLLRVLEIVKQKASTPNAGMTEKDFKKNITGKLPEPSKDHCVIADVLDKPMPNGKDIKWLALKVIDLIGSPNSQPLSYLCADKTGSLVLLLLYRTKSQAVKVFDTVVASFPPSSAATLAHNIEKIEGLEGSDVCFAIPTMVVEPNALVVNGERIPAKYFESPQMKTRQFQ